MNKKFRPTKVRFSPMPIKEEEVLLRYLNGSYGGVWKVWFNKNFPEYSVIDRNLAALKKELSGIATWRVSSRLQTLEEECVEAMVLAAPYLRH